MDTVADLLEAMEARLTSFELALYRDLAKRTAKLTGESVTERGSIEESVVTAEPHIGGRRGAIVTDFADWSDAEPALNTVSMARVQRSYELEAA